ncbi:monovalent cation/H(+) antiporter subunit G [Aurantimonas endophytica]|uniref:Multicomponent Na+:H+ antiporter subunit G n=1 Tax=Aurantimonas endophytica TaxID=1522175 RepID=A0A7W6HHG1_9HYPH|nr:monovalent cation/H(+) antiporter subunit G [Aurantimonas endophytica]MBB4004993.1 multicomponent Na+:H+ antiporter subunit G [Aurantimonas endophytica]MCO6405799.1 Na+/H+ antiporter subunit G [Aurantimonas endophytica]
MIGDLVLILAGLLVLAGSAFAAVAALGILRLPDVYTRMHSASKAGAVGAGMLLLALALTADSTPTALRALAAVVFILLTAPLAAHLLAKAAYSVGYKLGPESVLDEMPPPRPTNVGTDAPADARNASPQPAIDQP